MSGIITTGSFAKALWPGVKKWYGETYDEYPLEWAMLFDRETSTKAYEEYVQTVGTGLFPVKPAGEAITYDSRNQGYVSRLTNVTYALGFIVTKEAWDDDQYDVVVMRRGKALGRSARISQDTIAANVYNRAFNSSYAGADGKELLATDHPNYSGGTFSNELATAADMSEASIEQLAIQISQFTDDRGLLIRAMPDRLIVPPSLMFDAERIIKSTLQNDTANNAINAMKSMGLFRNGVTVNHFLTDTDAYFIKTSVEGLVGQVRMEPELAIDNDFDTSNAKFKNTFRMAWGWYDPRALVGSPGA